MNRKHSLLLVTAAAAGSVIYNIWKPIKSNLPVIEDFNLAAFLGEWHEIAVISKNRNDKIKKTTFIFRTNTDKTISRIEISDFTTKGKTKISGKKLKFRSKPTIGAFRITKFGPLTEGYNIMHIDEHYQYALLFGDNLDYMSILSRTDDIPDDMKLKYLEYIQNAGYAIEDVIWTNKT